MDSAKDFIESIHNFKLHKLKNKRIIDIQPDFVSNQVEYIQQELAAMGWKRTVFQDSFDTVQPQFVYRLDLKGKSLEQIFSQFDPLWQERIYLAERNNVTIELGTESAFAGVSSING